MQRFSSIKKAISYGAEKSSGNTVQRTPLSKQRNKHLQTTLIEAAKMAPRNSEELAMLYDKEKQKGNANRATLAVARKLEAYLMAVDPEARRPHPSRPPTRIAHSHSRCQFRGARHGATISIAHTPAGRIYIEARKFPSSFHASGVRNQ